jgi:hypothetical protein
MLRVTGKRVSAGVAGIAVYQNHEERCDARRDHGGSVGLLVGVVAASGALVGQFWG